MRKKFGLSLIEVLIGLALGTTISLILTRIVVSSLASYRIASGLEEIQDKARFLLTRFEQELQMVGYYQPASIHKIAGVDLLDEQRFMQQHPIILAGDVPFDLELGTHTLNTNFDQLVVGFQGQRDCRGFTLGYPDGEEFYVVNRYFVEDGLLFCVGYDGRVLRDQKSPEGHNRHRRVTLLEGVYQFKLRFGVTMKDDNQGSLRFVNGQVLNEHPQWASQVVAIQLGIVLMSDSEVVFEAPKDVYFMGENILLPDDNRLYFPFETMVYLRNVIGQSSGKAE